MRAIICLATVLSLLTACDGGGGYSSNRKKKKKGPDPGFPPPVQQKEKEPVAPFQGDGWLTDADIGGLQVGLSPELVQKMKAAGKPIILHSMDDEYTHKFDVGSEMLIYVRPATSSSEAASLCEEGRKQAKGTLDYMKNQGIAKHESIVGESTLGSKGWILSMVDGRRGQAINKVGGHTGSYYVRVVYAKSGSSEEKLNKFKVNAVTGTTYVLEKLKK